MVYFISALFYGSLLVCSLLLVSFSFSLSFIYLAMTTKRVLHECLCFLLHYVIRRNLCSSLLVALYFLTMQQIRVRNRAIVYFFSFVTNEKLIYLRPRFHLWFISQKQLHVTACDGKFTDEFLKTFATEMKQKTWESTKKRNNTHGRFHISQFQICELKFHKQTITCIVSFK